MDDLELIEERRKQIQADLEQLELRRLELGSELADLDVSHAVIQRLRQSFVLSPSLEGKTYAQAAKIILFDNSNHPISSSKIAEIAGNRGFRTKEGEWPSADQFRRRMAERSSDFHCKDGLYSLTPLGQLDLPSAEED